VSGFPCEDIGRRGRRTAAGFRLIAGIMRASLLKIDLVGHHTRKADREEA
jgi:hypothetical protein